MTVFKFIMQGIWFLLRKRWNEKSVFTQKKIERENKEEIWENYGNILQSDQFVT